MPSDDAELAHSPKGERGWRALCGEVTDGICNAHSDRAERGFCFLGAMNARTAVSAAFPIFTAHALAGGLNVEEVIRFASDESDGWWEDRIEELQSGWRDVAWDDDPTEDERILAKRDTYDSCADARDEIVWAVIGVTPKTDE